MQLTTLATVAACATAVSAHTRVFSVWVNGEDQGDGRDTYIRSPPSNSPVKDIDTPDIVCNVNGGKPASGFVTAAAGDTVSFEWYHDARGDDIIAASHVGPIITYIAPYTEGDGFTGIWSKIDEEGLAADGQTWAVDNLLANQGKKDVTLPAALQAGKYLVRQEIIGLHEANEAYADNSARGAQFYPSCVQFEITGDGAAVPDQNFDFKAGYSYEDPGIVYDIYGGQTTYEIPGPAVWSAEEASGSAPATGDDSSAAAPVEEEEDECPEDDEDDATVPAEEDAEDECPEDDDDASEPAAPTTTTSAVAAPTTLVTSTKATAAPATTSAAQPAPTSGSGSGSGNGDSSSGAAALYGQCGGINWTGATSCSAGTCKEMNPYYSQCIN
ncbi:hypothetical protein F4780DRAFT_470642 [Xylariomycetidae sp. FL0641]|nr:hypothetical protein F4780DRAFT_470642 [Xylariomycetidae sp. FL0641]